MFTFDRMKAIVITGRRDFGGKPYDHPDRVQRRAIRGPILAHVDRVLGLYLPGGETKIGAAYPSYLWTFPPGGYVIRKDGRTWGHVLPQYVYLSTTYNPPIPQLLVPVAALVDAGLPAYNVTGGNAVFFDMANSGMNLPEGYPVIEWATIAEAGWTAEEQEAVELGYDAIRSEIDAALDTRFRYQESEIHFPPYAVRWAGIDWFMCVPWYYPGAVLDYESGFILPFRAMGGFVLAPAELINVSGPNSPLAPGNYVPQVWGELNDTIGVVLREQFAAENQEHRTNTLNRMNELGASGETPSYAFAPKAFFGETGRFIKITTHGTNESEYVNAVTNGRIPRSGPRELFVPAMRAKQVEGVTDEMIQAAHDAIMQEVAAAQASAGNVPDEVTFTAGGNVGREPIRRRTNRDEQRIGYADPDPEFTAEMEEITSGEGAQSGSFGTHGGGGGISTENVLGYAAQIMAWYEQGAAGATDPDDIPPEMTDGAAMMGIMESYSDFKAGNYIGGACAAIAVAGGALQKAKIIDRSFPWKAFASSIASGAAAGASVGAGFVGIGAPIGAAVGAIVGAIACVIGWLCGRNPRGTIAGAFYAKGTAAWGKTYAPQAFIDWLEDQEMKGLFDTGVEECQQALLGWTVDELGHVLEPEVWAGAFHPDAWAGVKWSVAYPYPHGGGQISDEDAESIRSRSFATFEDSPWIFQAYRALGINYEESLKLWRETGEKGFVYIDQKALIGGADGGIFGGAAGATIAAGAGLMALSALGVIGKK